MRLMFLPLLLAACAAPLSTPAPAPAPTATARLAPEAPLRSQVTSPLGMDTVVETLSAGAVERWLKVPGASGAAQAGVPCRIYLDERVQDVVWVVAHEFGHCFQSHFRLPGLPRPDLHAYFHTPVEGFAQTYAEFYLARCGLSLRPLGLPDDRAPECLEAPDPRETHVWLAGGK